MKFILPGTMIRFANYQKEIDCSAATLENALRELVERHPTLASVLVDGNGSVRAMHKVFVNGELVEYDASFALTTNDRVEIVTAIAGG